MHLADAFIQSDLQCIQAKKILFGQYMCSYWELYLMLIKTLNRKLVNAAAHVFLIQRLREWWQKWRDIYIFFYTNLESF